MSGTTSKGKLACLAAAMVIGAALIAAPAQARGGGGWGGHGGGGWGGHVGGMGWGGHVGGMGWHGAGVGWRGAGVGWRGAAWNGGWRGAAWRGRFFPHRRFAFFGHRRFFGGPFFGLYASGYGSCWSWVPTAFGWRQVWVCGGPYGYGFY